MIKLTTLTASLLLMASSAAFAGGFGQPSQDWNANWNFSGVNQQSIDLSRAIAIKRAENDGYRSTYYTTNNVVNHIVNNTYCQVTDTCDTNVDSQTTAIGSNYDIVVDQDGDGSVTISDNDNLNNGDTAAASSVAIGGGDATSTVSQ